MMSRKSFGAILVVSLMIAASIFIRGNTDSNVHSFSITSGTEDIVIDFGQLDEGHEYKYVIKLANHSGMPFQVGKVISSCGCTKAELSTKTLDGSPAEFLITVKTAGKLIKLNEKISLIEAEPGSRLVNLILTGDLPDDNSLIALPPLLQFISDESEITLCLRRFSIQRRNKAVVTVLSVQSDVEWASVRQIELNDVLTWEVDTHWPVFEVLLDVPGYRRSPRKEGTITIVIERDETVTIPLIPNLPDVGNGAEG